MCGKECVESPEHERRQIVEYMWTQARDETVEHAEKLSSERVLGQKHDVWDVHTDKNRWWVVTNPTNLYSQSDFRSADGVLTFHLGLTARILARQAKTAPQSPEPRLEKMRRQWEQAAEAQDHADEAEEFQAVGMRCREVLVSFVHALATDAIVPDGMAPPKRSDFIHWSEVLADTLVPGGSNARRRSYLKALAKETWEFVSWLTHAKNAVRADGDFAVRATGYLLSKFETELRRKEAGGPDRCPSCGSYRLDDDMEYDEDLGELVHWRFCEVCDWSEDYEPEPIGAVPTPAVEPEGECLPSSEL